MNETLTYMLYREKALRQKPAEVAGNAQYFKQLGMKIGINRFTGLNRISPLTYTSWTSCTTSILAYSNM